MIDFLTMLINGLSLGGVYALIALGYTMVYGIAKMLNFAHGDIIMVGGYAIVVFFNLTGMPVVSILAAVAICIALGIAIEKVAYKPLRQASPLAVLITAIGVSYLLQSFAQMFFGAGGQTIVIENLGSLTIGELKIKWATMITLIVAVVIMVSLTIFINKSKVGKAMLAVSEDKEAAQLMGINVNTIVTITFAIGSALAAVAGACYIMKTPNVSPTLGSLPGIKAFTAAVIGGIGSIPGAMLGGILLGMIEIICNSVPALSGYTVAIEFGLLILILLVRPTGILGKQKREKV
ncbi:MAG: branched-chain amino acid ABC transporter permease [Clostridia bacterium]|nr:branched-chain amino acid ABC transporter permease [Clostridia bacterium]